MEFDVDGFRLWLSSFLKPSTVSRHVSVAARFARWLEANGIDVEQVDPSVAMRWLSSLGVSERSMPRYLESIELMLRYLGRGGVKLKPGKALFYLKHEDRVPHSKIVWGVQRYLDWWKMTGDLSLLRDAALIWTAYEWALRRREVTLLNRDDFNPDARLLAIYRLKRRGREYERIVVPISDTLTKLLKLWLENRDDSCEALFIQFDPPRRISSEAVRRIGARFLRLVGAPSTRFHVLRHSRLSNAAAMGADIKELMEISHHRDPRVLTVYLHPTHEEIRAMLERKGLLGDELKIA